MITAYAVAQRRRTPKAGLDFFPTPPWATRAFCEWEFGGQAKNLDVWEPACGAGDMARPLAEYFGIVHASDVHAHVDGFEVADFLFPSLRRASWIITNPPFRLAQQFAETAIERADRGVAFLVRTAFLEGVGRHRDLFSRHRPSAVLQFSERVPMALGRLSADTVTATAYCWIVWRNGNCAETRFDWIPPCRRRLERPGDYRDNMEGDAA